MATKKPEKRRAAPSRAQAAKPASQTKRPIAPHLSKVHATPEQEPAPAGDDALPAFAIVGVGASAGGLEALSQLLRALPSDSGIAMIIVQHMAPRHESMLAHLLAESSVLPVAEVTDDVVVEVNHVYVIPPNREMGISGGRLHLMPRPDNRTQFNPIDFFLRSLAEYAQTRAIGVILSGTASDGAIGLREIKGAGGIAIAQEPKSAKYDGMPRAAVATGMVDLVLPPAEIARELTRIGQHLAAGLPVPTLTDAAEKPGDADSSPPPPLMARIFSLLRNASGVDFTHYKLPTIRRRLQRRMVLHKIVALEPYVRFLEQNAAEVSSLYSDLLIHVTRFFRDPDSFHAMNTEVFRAILQAVHNGSPVRVWVPGCSTGEEAYSVAIALLEFLGDEAPGTGVQIFATDVSETAVEQARMGIYPESISADVSPERLRRFFDRVDGSFRINKIVRDLCIFARHDVTRDPPFSKLDLIVCRNVLIYLDALFQKKLMQVFHYALRPNGYLMLGAAETVGPHSDLFAITDKKFKIYTKKLTSVVHRAVGFPSLEFPPPVGNGGRRAALDTRSGNNVQQEANRIILSRYSPPGVIVDSDLKIIQFRGQTGHYLEPAPGEASLNLLKMAREGLLHGLRTAIHDVIKKESAVRKEGLRIKVQGHVREVDLEVVPLAAPEGRHFLILFHDRSSGHPAPQSETPPAAQGKIVGKSKGRPPKLAAEEGRLLRLQQELAASREYLQSIIQDLEAANEELQSANEEILSSNEELQSTNEELDTAKEELQSTNEELNTVNEELQGRNEELSGVNSDLVNLLGSVQIAIVMVAADLRIRRFTPMAEKVLNLIPSDVGRPISDIKPNIDCPDLERLIAEAIDSVTIKEREAQDRHGNWYLLRIRPYKNVENRIDGAVLALFDVNSSHRQISDRAAAPEAIGALLEAIHEPVLLLDSKHVVRAANRRFLTQLKMGGVVGRPIFELAEGKWNSAELRKVLDEVLPREGWAEGINLKGDLLPDGKNMVVRARRQLIGGELMTLIAFDAADSA